MTNKKFSGTLLLFGLLNSSSTESTTVRTSNNSLKYTTSISNKSLDQITALLKSITPTQEIKNSSKDTTQTLENLEKLNPSNTESTTVKTSYHSLEYTAPISNQSLEKIKDLLRNEFQVSERILEQIKSIEDLENLTKSIPGFEINITKQHHETLQDPSIASELINQYEKQAERKALIKNNDATQDSSIAGDFINQYEKQPNHTIKLSRKERKKLARQRKQEQKETSYSKIQRDENAQPLS